MADINAEMGSSRPSPEVSVVIPARDAASVLPAQLEALASQLAPPPFEVIVADNGSRDDIGSVVTAFADRLDIHLVDASGTCGSSFARNAGVAAASTQQILFCDADDLVAPRWVRAMAFALKENELAAGPVLYRRRNELPSPSAAFPEPSARLPDRPRNYLDQAPFAPSNNLAMSAGLFHALGGFDETLLQDQDADLTIRAHQAGHTLVWVPDAVVFNVVRPSLTATARQFFWYGVYDAAVYRKLRGQGLDPRPWRVMYRPYVVLTLTAYRLLTPRRRSWVTNAAQRAGRIVGSIRFRVLCL